MKDAKPEEVQLPYLETFSKVAELSSFTAAAKALALTQAMKFAKECLYCGGPGAP
jgi:hypothetical protein